MPASKPRQDMLFLLSFSTQFAVDVVAVAVPIFALSLSATPFQIGLLATSRGLVYSALPFIVGHLLVKADNKRILLLATLTEAATASALYFARVPLELIILRIFEGLAMAMFWPTIESLIANFDQSRISASIRSYNVSWGLGQVIGPIIGGGLITFIDVRSPFLIVVAVVTINLGLILRYNPQSSKPKIRDLSDAERGIPIKLVSAVTFLGMSGAIFSGFFPAFGTKLGLTALEIGFILFLFGAVRVFFFYKASAVKSGLVFRILLASVGFFLVHLGTRATMYFGVVTVAAASSLLYTYCIERMLGEGEAAARRAGIFEGSLGVGSILGPLLAGLVAEWSFSYTFVMASILGIVLTMVLKVPVHLTRYSRKVTTP